MSPGANRLSVRRDPPSESLQYSSQLTHPHFTGSLTTPSRQPLVLSQSEISSAPGTGVLRCRSAARCSALFFPHWRASSARRPALFSRTNRSSFFIRFTFDPGNLAEWQQFRLNGSTKTQIRLAYFVIARRFTPIEQHSPVCSDHADGLHRASAPSPPQT